MYCPRCGSPNTDTTKFCRQCGLSMTQLSGYIASGGTGALKDSGSVVDKVTEGLTLKQRLVLTILLWVLSPAFLAIFSEAFNMKFVENLIPFVAVLMPVGIVWSVFRYKAQKSRLEAQTGQTLPEGYRQPVIEQYRPPVDSPPTNPLDARQRAPHSVTEDDTRHL